MQDCKVSHKVKSQQVGSHFGLLQGFNCPTLTGFLFFFYLDQTCFKSMTDWPQIKPVYKKENKNSHLTLPNRNHLLKVTEQGPYELEKNWHQPFISLLFFVLALLWSITKTGQLWAGWCRVAWLWCKRSLGCFPLPCSLFALSLRLTTPSEQTHLEMCL